MGLGVGVGGCGGWGLGVGGCRVGGLDGGGGGCGCELGIPVFQLPRVVNP